MPAVVYHTESGGRLRGRRRGFSAAAGGRGFPDPSRGGAPVRVGESARYQSGRRPLMVMAGNFGKS